MSENKTIRKAVVRVEYMRGVSDGRPGWWVVEHCRAEDLFVTSFLHADKIPSEEAIATHVIGVNEVKGLGISGRGGSVILIGKDDDHAAFDVLARVVAA